MADEKVVLDGDDMRRTLVRIAHEIVENGGDPDALALVGIHRRGAVLAGRLQELLSRLHGIDVPLGDLDITLYRDDLSTIAPNPVVKATRFPVAPDGRIVVLCDDVLYTGRTVRAALDALVDYGRPRAVELAVLIDRGHRELPIQADVVGKTVPTAANEVIKVAFASTDDGKETVQILERTGA